jgi:anti-sigma regulatory factor (Ser/Thr protein kinase)
MVEVQGMRAPFGIGTTDGEEAIMAEKKALYSASFEITGNDYDHGGAVAAQVKRILKEIGIAPDVTRRLSIANFEAEMNVIMYARRGTLELEVHPDRVQVVVSDDGPGIPDIELAMQVGYTTATPEMRARGFGAGLGLPNIKRNTDEFELVSTVGVGTTLTYSVHLS